MEEIVRIIAFQDESNWLVSPMPGQEPVEDPLGTRMGLKSGESHSRWGEQLEQGPGGFTMSSYVKPIHAKIVVMAVVPHSSNSASGLFLFRRRVQYPKLRLFQFSFRLRKREWIECLSFSLQGSGAVASVAMNDWFRLVVYNNTNSVANAYIEQRL